MVAADPDADEPKPAYEGDAVYDDDAALLLLSYDDDVISILAGGGVTAPAVACGVLLLPLLMTRMGPRERGGAWPLSFRVCEGPVDVLVVADAASCNATASSPEVEVEALPAAPPAAVEALLAER